LKILDGIHSLQSVCLRNNLNENLHHFTKGGVVRVSWLFSTAPESPLPFSVAPESLPLPFRSLLFLPGVGLPAAGAAVLVLVLVLDVESYNTKCIQPFCLCHTAESMTCICVRYIWMLNRINPAVARS
jgi:hypothetical protein